IDQSGRNQNRNGENYRHGEYQLMAVFSKSQIWRIARDQQGFTLIEIFISIVLLTIGLLGTAALTTGVVRGNLASKNITTATALAQSCLEENRRVGYTNAGAGT